MKARSLFKAALASAAFVITAWASPRDAVADPLDDAEYATLLRGEVVGRPLDVNLAGGSYFGVVTYAVIEASPDDVMAAILDPAAYTEILPRTLSAEPVGQVGELRYVRLTQGGKLGTASYTIVVQRAGKRRVRFWLDPSKPHDIADLWGFFSVEPAGEKRSLVRWGALVRLDFGVVKMLFTSMIRGYAFETPGHLKSYVESKTSRR